jgi:hypothetical protein
MKQAVLFVSIVLIIFFYGLGQALCQTPSQLVIGLMSSVRSLKLDPGIENSLLVKLKGANGALSSLNVNHYKEASINKLNAFKNEVEALAGKFLTEDQAKGLLGQADLVIKRINGTTIDVIGISGGIVEISDTSSPIYGASVLIPSGALSSEELITIVEELSPEPLPTNLTSAGPVVQFGPEGLTFSQPVTISVPYSEISGIPEEKIKIYTFNKTSNRFEEVPVTRRDPEKNLLYAEVYHFSPFQPAAPSGDPDAPYFDWTILVNVTRPSGGKMTHRNALVIHPQCGEGSDVYCVPDHISSLKVTGPMELTYDFIKGDYWFDAFNKYVLRDFLGRDVPFKWYYAQEYRAEDLPSGEYTFEVTDIYGKKSSITRTLSVDPIPCVDSATIQICRILDESNTNCLEWSQADWFEALPTDKPLKIKWDPVFYGGKIAYYDVRIYNSYDSGLPIYRSSLTADTEITISASIVGRILLPNAVYQLNVFAWDDYTRNNSHNRSHSSLVRFATGSVSLSNFPIFSLARVVTNHYPDNYYELLYTAQVRRGVGGPIMGPNEVSISATGPDGSAVQLTNYTSGTFWQAIPKPASYQTGGYIFKAVDNEGRETYLRDYFNKARLLPLPILISPNNGEVVYTLTPTFSWSPVDGAKTYHLLVEKLEGNQWQTVFFKSWLNETEFTLPGGILENGKNYRWRIRAYDSYADSLVDNRSNSVYRYFSTPQ